MFFGGIGHAGAKPPGRNPGCGAASTAAGAAAAAAAAGIAGIAANIFVSLVTLNWMGHNGLALATTMASIVNMMVFFLFLRKHLPGMNFGPMVISSAKILISTVIMAVAVAFYMRVAAGLGDAGIILGGIFIGIVVYLLCAVFLRIREWLWLKEMIWKKIGREIRR